MAMPVLPMTSSRLMLRMMRAHDAPIVAAYRSDPEIAKYQDWDMPYDLGRAERSIAKQQAWDDVTPGEWVQVAIEHDGLLVGDVAVGLTTPGVAYLGYTLGPEHHGRGYASEAAGAIVDALFDRGDIHRVVATLDPQNTASRRLLEQLGFVDEGTARQAELIRGEWLDDLRMAVLRDERAAWRSRDRTPPTDVRMVPIEPGEGRRWGQLRTHGFQRQFVSPIFESLADAILPPIIEGFPLVPWYRGIEADGRRVGFIMIAQASEGHPHPYLWRLVIDRWHQRRGIAIRVLRQLIDDLRAQGHQQLYVSYVLAPGGPEPLYRELGFVPNGDLDDGETVAVLTL
jgi:RimJ/RimL family protein N-acetyltransferase